MVGRVLGGVGRSLAAYLQRPSGDYLSFSVTAPAKLRATLRAGDVLLVEGNTRVSTAIKYLTQSTWSHAVFCAGSGNQGPELIEADLKHGVRMVGLEEYSSLNTRICRPVELQPDDLAGVCAHMRAAIGRRYDLKNIVDLARYLLPQPPVPARFRRKMLALGSGDPTRAICSTLIAEGFQSVHYPILPIVEQGASDSGAQEILRIRHHSLFVPRDFDLSPYFRIVKPTIEAAFDYRDLVWDDAGRAGI